MYRFDLTGLTKENSFIHSGLNFVLYKEDTPAGFLEERVGVGFLQGSTGSSLRAVKSLTSNLSTGSFSQDRRLAGTLLVSLELARRREDSQSPDI